MSFKYVSVRSEWWEANAADSLAKTVFEQEAKPVDTGLFDARGVKLFRVEQRDPIGFLRFPHPSNNKAA